MTPDSSDEIRLIAQSLFDACDRGQVRAVELLVGGRNNRVYRVAGNGLSAILKQYYRSPDGGHDRFASEVAWCRFCDQFQLHWTPLLWASDPISGCALFEESPGRRVTASDVDAAAVSQAAQFLAAVNQHRDTAAAQMLPHAAEARFSWHDHLQTIQRRLDRLATLIPHDDLDQALLVWWKSEFTPVWEAVRAKSISGLTESQLHAALPRPEWCLSPSDFGFHNAWRLPGGELRFLDFEYAGWDDPAKLVCDFYWQVDLPAPRETMPLMIAALTTDIGMLSERVWRLFPAFGMKWCGIILNEFLPTHRDRRRFAMESIPDQRHQQFVKAQLVLQDVITLMNSPEPISKS